MAENFFIKNISDLKNCGVFNSWPKGSLPFGRYNLIYGWNGSGKTTFTRLMHSLKNGVIDPALTKNGATPSFQFQLLNDSNISSKSLSGWHDKIRVFNDDFVRENINVDEANAQPVYHLGKEQGDAIGKLEKVREQLEKGKKELESQQKRCIQISEAKDGALTERGKTIGVATNDRTFDRTKLRKILDKFKVDQTDTDLLILNEVELSVALNTATGSNDKNIIDEIGFAPKRTVHSIHVASKNACESCVTKIAIEKLDANSKMRRWAEEGLSLHKDMDTCAFCDAKITDNRIDLLNQYFNDAYKSLMDSISAEQGNIKTLISEIETVKPLDDSRLYQELREKFKVDAERLISVRVALVSACNEIDSILTNKKSHLTEVLPIVSFEAFQEKFTAFVDAIKNLNQTIIAHNERYRNFQTVVQEARTKILYHYSASHYAAYNHSLDEIESINKESLPIKDSVKSLLEEEMRLDAQLREHDKALDRINELLAAFLGRSDIKLITHEKGYYIEREGVRAKHLSEGEKTAIAFTYFISKMEEKEFNVENSVIVVDDPISSLDTNALYAAGSFIRCHLERASQVFILTHNYHFFREIFGWIKGIKTPDKDKWHQGVPYKSHIMFRCEMNSTGKRESIPCKLDNTLRDYDSEYLFLFKQLYESHGNVKFTENITPEELSKLAILPNVARRVLETFILFKFPDKANGGVINLYGVIKPLEVQIQTEKISILDRLLNRTSHGSEDSMTSINMFNLSETPKVIEYALDFIEQADVLHYNGLKRAIGVKDN